MQVKIKSQKMVSKIEHKNRTGCPIACSLDILGDHFASEDYRKHLAKVYAKRAILAALG